MAVFSLFLLAVMSLGSAQVCEDYAVCRDCITDPSCLWCSDEDLSGTHCFNQTSDVVCATPEDPHGKIISIEEGSPTEQVTPATVRLDLRVGEPQTFTVSVTPQANYPLDLYILMDLSQSMSDDLDSIRSLSVQLAATLGNITTNFRIGFGSFVEKPIQPFIDDRVIPNTGSSVDYSYRHVVTLTEDVDLFQTKIRDLVTVTNIDSPEAMFDGIMQAAVCQEVVGWRENTRRLMLVLSDNTYHMAGDGKLAGILRPHDGNCYVPLPNGTESVDYQFWGVFDYPSVGHIDSKLRENDIIPIFASVDDFSGTYQALVEQIEGAVFQTLDVDSDNFLEVIRSSYNVTSQRVELQPIDTLGIFNFAIIPDCADAIETADGACEGVQVNQTVSFTVSVSLATCTEELAEGNSIQVILRVPGFGRVSMEVTGLCSCACETGVAFNSTQCSSSGNLTCGVCKCFEDRYGRNCQCTEETTANLPCPVEETSQLPCSGRGVCQCGECICDTPNPSLVPPGAVHPRYYGDRCQFDNFGCDTGPNGVLCSGRGVCDNDTCTCGNSTNSGGRYHGGVCECLPWQEVCINPQDDQLQPVNCSGRGECGCSQCTCEEDYTGVYCNFTVGEILMCDGAQCVLCAKGSSNSGCDNCSVLLIDPVTDPGYEINGIPAAECTFEDDDDCLHVYFTVGSEGPIHAENTKDCPEGLFLPIWAIVVIAVGIILLLGALLFIGIKVTLVLLDHHEYKKFQLEVGEAEFSENENPLYHSPEQQNTNPIYRTPSKRAKSKHRIDIEPTSSVVYFNKNAQK